MNNYNDIILEKRYIPRCAMSREDRAAQFSAFAALTGFDGVILETGRLTDGFIDMDDGELLVMNAVLCRLMEQIHEKPTVQLTWFRADDRKEGGAYVPYTGNLKKIDEYNRVLIFTDGTRISIDTLTEINWLQLPGNLL